MAEIKLLKIGFKWKDLSEIDWTPCDVGRNGQRFYDTNVRQSFEAKCEIPETNTGNLNGGPTSWRMLKYENGFFDRHIDNQVDPYHSGVDVLLPPQSLNSYKGGQLIIFQPRSHYNYVISAHNQLWTMVRIPLGTIHKICKVNGTRISFVRRVYDEKPFHFNRNSGFLGD